MLETYFDAKGVEGTPPSPSWNVAPTQDVPIIAERLDEGTIDRHLLIARWDLFRRGPSTFRSAPRFSARIEADTSSIAAASS